jgi:uncharacterized protein involved in outer membrane biogenesis
MKIKKILLWGGLGLVALLVVGLIVMAFFLDGIVKTGVNTIGPQIVKVPLTLESIHIGILSGSATVKGLVIGNPDGYKTPNAISVGRAEVSVDLGSALSDKIIIHSVHVESPEITFEGGLSGNNLSKIEDNLNESAKTLQGSGASGVNATTPVPAGSKQAKKLEVDDFLITGAKVHVSLTGLGGKEMDLPIPDIHLTDLGKGTDGMTPAELLSQVFKAVTASTLHEVTAAVSNLGKDTEKAAQGAVKKLTSGLGGLFK